MARSTLQIPTEVINVLRRSRIEGNQLFLPEQLDRKLYVATDKILKTAGGKWNRGKGAHVFESCPADILGVAIESGKIDDKKTGLQQFFTTEPVRRLVRGVISIEDDWSILEPSAGHGDLLEGVIREGTRDRVTCVEIDPENVTVLRSRGYTAIQTDFLTFPVGASAFDLVLMNPPFDRQLWTKHVRHALQFVKHGGRLISVIPGATLTEASRSNIFDDHDDLIVDYDIHGIEDGAFKESGTAVRTSLLSCFIQRS